MAEPNYSELFIALVDWMKSIGVDDASKGPQPWRGELKTANGDTLKIGLNASKEPIEDDGLTMTPYSAAVRSEKFFAIATLNPYGGALVGFREDDLIEVFKNATASGSAP